MVRKCTFLVVAILLSFSINAQKTIYYNGKILIDDNQFVKWFVVDNNTIVDIGDNTLTNNDIANYEHKINLNGKTVIPGFVDSHIHFMDGALGLIGLSLVSAQTLEETKKMIQENTSNLIDGMLIFTSLSTYLINKIENPRNWLDSVTGTIPTFILTDGHMIVANSAGLNLIEFNNNTTIIDGKLLKDQKGELTGVLVEQAAFKANQKISEQYSTITLQKAVLKAQKVALSYGITSMGDNMFTPLYYKVYKELHNNDKLKIRLFARSFGTNKYTYALLPGLNVPKLGFIGKGVDTKKMNYHTAKYFITEGLTPSPEMLNDTLLKKNPGAPTSVTFKNIEKFILTYDIPLAFHIQGKEGLRRVIDAIEKTKSRTGDRRHVLDHIGYAETSQLHQIKNNKLAATLLPYQLFEYPLLKEYYTKNSLDIFNEAYLLDYKSKYTICKAALSSDWPYAFDGSYAGYSHVDGLNPFPAIAITTSGITPEGENLKIPNNKLLDIFEGVYSYTRNGAYVLGKENTLGKIAVGYQADFLILQDDIFSMKTKDIYSLKVDKVFIAGEEVYTTEEQNNKDTENNLTNIKNTDYAVSPVFGYDPSLAFILGGAFFKWSLTEKGPVFNTQLLSTTTGQVKLISEYQYNKFTNKLSFGANGYYRTFFDAYYGEGTNSKKGDRVNLYHNIININVFLKHHTFHNTSFILQTKYRYRQEEKVENIEGVRIENRKISPDENNLLISMKGVFDNRDMVESPRSGALLELGIDYLPPGLSTLSSNDNLLQLNFNSSYFKNLYFPRVILGLRMAGGTTLNATPSYINKYQLGGEYLLRGYFTNRFRGSHYYHATTELRFPIFLIVSGSVFTDIGDVADDKISDFGATKFSYGGGLRFKLSEMAKLRFDLGFEASGWGLFFTFNEAF